MKNVLLIFISFSLFSFNNTQTSNNEESDKYLKQAIEEEHNGQESKALISLNKAIEIHSKNVDALEERGDLLKILGNYDDAQNDYEKALDIAHSEKLYYKLAVLHSEIGEDLRSLFYITKALEFDFENYEYYYYKGLSNMNLGNNVEALSDFSKADKIHKNDHNVYYHRALVHIHMHHYQLGITDLNKAIDLFPNIADYYYEKGLCYSKLKNYEKAIIEFTKAIDIGDDIDTYLDRGLAYDELSMFDLAEADIRNYLKQNPDNPSAQYQYGLIEYHAKKYTEAEKYFNMVLKTEKENTKALFYRGMVYYYTDRKDDACKEFKNCKKLGYNSGWNKMKEHCK